MRFLVITPVHNDALIARIREGILKKHITGAELVFVGLDRGPAVVEGFVDEVFSGPEVVHIVHRNEADFDGFFINCCGDVAVDALREITDKPVLGAGEASYFLASAAGVPFSIITIGSNAQNKANYRYRELGCSRYIATVGIPEGVMGLSDSPSDTAEHIVSAAKKQQTEQGAELFVLGCTGMIDVYDEVKKRLGCPVIEPGTAGIKLLETFVTLGVSHTRGGRYTPTRIQKEAN